VQPDSSSAGLQWQAMSCTRGTWFLSGKGIFLFGSTFGIGCRSNSASFQLKPGRSTNLVTHPHLELKLRMCILLPQRPCQFAWWPSAWVSLTAQSSTDYPCQVHASFLKKCAGNENLLINTYCATFVVFKSVTVKIPVLWAVTPCGLHKSADTSIEHNASIVNMKKRSFTLKTAAVCSSETLPNS
jgi:hypothetical protein